ncbi:MAG: hypothetical protein ABL903_09460 [Methylococcales bacterium]
MNTPPAKDRWFRVTAKSRIDRPYGRFYVPSLPPIQYLCRDGYLHQTL